MQMRLAPLGASGKARILWDPVSGASGYDLVMGDLANVFPGTNLLDLGAVSVLATGTTTTEFQEGAGTSIPAPGRTFFYLMQYHAPDGSGIGFGSESAPLPRVPSSCGGGCP